MRDRISRWIGQPIDQRAVLGSAVNPLRAGKEPNREIVAYNEVNRLCWTIHDVLWVAWRGIGEAFVRDHDAYMLNELKRGFGSTHRCVGPDVRPGEGEALRTR